MKVEVDIGALLLEEEPPADGINFWWEPKSNVSIEGANADLWISSIPSTSCRV